jgi:hypothetical protein
MASGKIKIIFGIALRRRWITSSGWKLQKQIPGGNKVHGSYAMVY